MEFLVNPTQEEVNEVISFLQERNKYKPQAWYFGKTNHKMRDEDSRFTEEGSILLLESIYSHFGGRCSYFDEDNVIFVSSSSLSISYIIASAAILYCNKKKKDESEICHLLLAIEHLTRGEIPDYLIRHKKQALSILANIPSLKDNSAFFREATLFILKKVVS